MDSTIYTRFIERNTIWRAKPNALTRWNYWSRLPPDTTPSALETLACEMAFCTKWTNADVETADLSHSRRMSSDVIRRKPGRAAHLHLLHSFMYYPNFKFQMFPL